MLFRSEVFALAPHEILVVANRNESASVRVAQAYIKQWDIPRQNLVLLSLLPDESGKYATISPDGFSQQIWNPTQDLINRRELNHILAWVYSTHIPYRVTHSPPLSLHGLTFLRNQIPASDAIQKAGYSSPLFAGPSAPGGTIAPTQSFFPASQALGGQMPLPAMSLGYIGEHGNTESEILGMLRRSRDVHASSPSGTVYFVTRDDIRSRVREWQFEPVVQWLNRIGTPAVITNSVPEHAPSILGMVLGTPSFDTASMGIFAGGAVGEHLTSFGATFDQASQTKISRWISSGVSGTAGTVCEPYAIWAKFLHARFFAHYRTGCSLIESFYLSVRSPLQTYFIGDPLLAPWAVPAKLQIAGIRDGELLQEARSIDLHVEAPYGVHYGRVVYMVNGKEVGRGTSFTLDPGDYEAGLHEFRAVVYRAGFVQDALTATVRFRIGL